MTHHLAVEQLPQGSSSFELWEHLRENGVTATVIVLDDESRRKPGSIVLEFATSEIQARAHNLLESHGALLHPRIARAM